MYVDSYVIVHLHYLIILILKLLCKFTVCKVFCLWFFIYCVLVGCDIFNTYIYTSIMVLSCPIDSDVPLLFFIVLYQLWMIFLLFIFGIDSKLITLRFWFIFPEVKFVICWHIIFLMSHFHLRGVLFTVHIDLL